MFVKFSKIIRDKDTNAIIMVGKEDTSIIAEITDTNVSQPWDTKIKTCVTGEKYIRSDCYSYQLLNIGNWVKLNNGDKVMVISANNSGFGFLSSDGSEKKATYVDKNGKLNFTPCATPKKWGETLSLGDFSHTYEEFSGQIHNYYSGYCNEKYIFKNFVQYAQKKLGLINLLRKHPNWNESEKAVIVNTKIAAAPDVGKATEILRNFLAKHRVLATNGMTNATLCDLLYWFKWSDNYCIPDDNSKPITFRDHVFDTINSSIGRNIPKGTKATKIVRLILTQYCDLHEADGFEKMYAQFSDILTRQEKTIKFVVSANICDFVTMSHGNSWSSCHSFKSKGGWHCGSLSYANDYVTLVVYGVEASAADKNIYDQPKLFRNLFMLNEDQTEYIQSRMYPTSKLFSNDSVNSLFNSVINECGLNINVTPVVTCAGQYKTNTGSLQYTDYDRFGYRYGGDETVIAIGGPVYHLTTGKLLLSSGNMSNCWVGYYTNDKKYNIITKKSKKDLKLIFNIAA